jgi:hypothetical protein
MNGQRLRGELNMDNFDEGIRGRPSLWCKEPQEARTVSGNVVPIACDLVAITLVVAIYFHRHQRRDLLLAYVALNIGILSVTVMLTSASIGAGLGLGLFGILSIIRLRSDSITQEEIAYYFVALALGLLAGVAAGPPYVVPLLIGLLVLAMYVADHPRLLPRARRQLLTLDMAIPNDAVLRAHIESRLGFDVRHLIVQELDFVRDVTVVDIRYRVSNSPLLLASDGHPTAGLDLPAAAGGRPVVAENPLAVPVAQNGTSPLHAAGNGQAAPITQNGTSPLHAAENVHAAPITQNGTGPTTPFDAG